MDLILKWEPADPVTRSVGRPSREEALACLLGSVRGLELLVMRVVATAPLEVEVIGAEVGRAVRRPLDDSPLRAVVESGATLTAPNISDEDPLLWTWDGEPEPGALAVPAQARGATPSPPSAAVLAWHADGSVFTDEEIRRVENLACVVGAVLTAGDDEPEAGPAGGIDTSLVHDLRTPLTVSSGYLAMLRDGSLGEVPKPAARALTVVAAKNEEARLLVDEILLSTRLEAGRVQTQLATVDLLDAAQSAARRAEPRASLAGAEIVVVPGEHVAVTSDARLIARVLDNLVNNALIYSSSSPRIELSVTGEGSSGVIRVADNGIGIPEPMRDSIFEKFVRVDDRGTRSGTGLGLHTGRQIAERLGGGLHLEGTVSGRGSVFALRLPADVDDGSGRTPVAR